jgi:hypothetical protein
LSEKEGERGRGKGERYGNKALSSGGLVSVPLTFVRRVI